MPMFTYDIWLDKALRKVVYLALEHVMKEGVFGDHALYITFLTQHTTVEIPEDLKKQYPEEMTIVLQHEFWNLTLTPDSFSVTLAFNETPYRLNIPLEAVVAFSDPAVQFFLRFDPPQKKSNETPTVKKNIYSLSPSPKTAPPSSKKEDSPSLEEDSSTKKDNILSLKEKLSTKKEDET